MSAGLLIVWTDIPAEIDADFNAWYDREHLPERILRMPGFLRGRRYAATSTMVGAPKYLTYYDLQSTAVMLSDAHIELRKHRTERDRFFVPRFRNTIKGICDVRCRAGNGDGEFLVLMPVVAEAGREEDFAKHVCRDLLPALARERGVASAVFGLRNQVVTQASSAKDDRGGDRYLEGLIAVEAASENAAIAAAAFLDKQLRVQAAGHAHLIAAPCVLRLTFALQAPHALDVICARAA